MEVCIYKAGSDICSLHIDYLGYRVIELIGIKATHPEDIFDIALVIDGQGTVADAGDSGDDGSVNQNILYAHNLMILLIKGLCEGFNPLFTSVARIAQQELSRLIKTCHGNCGIYR